MSAKKHYSVSPLRLSIGWAVAVLILLGNSHSKARPVPSVESVDSRKRSEQYVADQLNAAYSRLTKFVYPRPTRDEDALLSLEQHLGYAKECIENNKTIYVEPVALGSGFSNKLIGFTNLLYYSRANNVSVLVTRRINNMLFAHYDTVMISRYFCVTFEGKDGRNKVQSAQDENLLFYWRRVHKVMNSSEFRYTVLKHILLRPKKHVYRAALAFLRERGWEDFTAIHLRSFPPFFYVFRNFIPQCIHCAFTSHMSNKYVQHMRLAHGTTTARRNLFLMTDGYNVTDVQRLRKLGAVQINSTRLSNPGDRLHVEILVASFATLFLGSPSSSLSTNIAIVQKGLEHIDFNYTGAGRTYTNNVLPILVPNFMR